MGLSVGACSCQKVAHEALPCVTGEVLPFSTVVWPPSRHNRKMEAVSKTELIVKTVGMFILKGPDKEQGKKTPSFPRRRREEI